MRFSIDLKKPPQSIAIELHFDGPQPNHFGADRASASPMKSGSFIGDTRQGGSCNAQDIYLNPHCNGTHTESISHVINQLIAPHKVIKQPLMLASVISIESTPAASINADFDSYRPPINEADSILCKQALTAVKKLLHKDVKALIIRTLPNSEDKTSCRYGDDFQPPFFSHEAMQWLVNETEIEHLLVDLPSVDRLNDDGLLSNHRIFWNIEMGSHQSKEEQFIHKTITEMVYVPDDIKDGTYLLSLQVPKLNLNAVPSNPLLYHIK